MNLGEERQLLITVNATSLLAATPRFAGRGHDRAPHARQTATHQLSGLTRPAPR